MRLRNAYVIRYEGMVKNPATGAVEEIHCTCDFATRNAPPADGRKIPGVIHWVAAAQAVPAEVRLYDRLFRVPEPQDEDYTRDLNPDSLEILTDCYLEAGLRDAAPGARYQFERLGYFSVDPKDSQPGRPVLNRIVPLRDSWAKIAGSGR